MAAERTFNGVVSGQTLIPDNGVAKQIAAQNIDLVDSFRVRINDDPVGFLLDPGDKWGVRKNSGIYKVTLVPVANTPAFQLTFL